MRVANADQNVTELLAMLEESTPGPIVVRKGSDFAYLVSPEEYRRLKAEDWDAFDRARTSLSQEAVRNGLTEEILAGILAEIDAEAPR